jgi:parallel beta-helix repeat protein
MLMGNNASNNQFGISLAYFSNNNTIYNNYFSNTNNAFDDGNNIWNIPKTSGTNIINGAFSGGNFWSDYDGIDTDGDGLGDTMLPYTSSDGITDGGDNLPLVHAILPGPGVLNIISFSPATSTMTNNVSESRIFSITTNQTVNVAWYIKETEVFNETDVTTSTYTSSNAAVGRWNVTAVASNNNGTTKQTWDWVVQPIIMPGAPEITNFTPASPVNDIIGATRTFTINVNQTANVTWYINETEVFTLSGVTQSSYTNTITAAGTWNIIARMVNENGSVGQTWVWTVTPVPTTCGLISGHKINDTNGNGRWDESEKGMSNWTIRLSDRGDSNIKVETVTDENGFYEFNDIPKGNYRIQEVMQTGWKHTSSDIRNIKLKNGQRSMNNNFTNKLKKPDGMGIISGFKINDTNGNGKWDAGEKGISNWTIRLIGNGDSHIKEETLTDETGFYEFNDIPKGDYRIQEVMQTGWKHTSSDIRKIKLKSGQRSMNNNFTNRLKKPDGKGIISGFKINDTNSNGKWDAGEKGISNWTIRLIGKGDSDIKEETVTDKTGFYEFNDIPRGNYRIQEVMQTGWQHTSSDIRNIKLDYSRPFGIWAIGYARR